MGSLGCGGYFVPFFAAVSTWVVLIIKRESQWVGESSGEGVQTGWWRYWGDAKNTKQNMLSFCLH